MRSLAAVVAIGICSQTPITSAESRGSAPAPGNGAARLPDTSSGGDYWELVARFESGHLIFAQTLLTTLGWGGRKAAVVGAVALPDGRVLPFRRTEKAGGWHLSDDRRTLDLQAVLLEQREGMRRLWARKSGLEVAVEIDSPGVPGDLADARPGCAMAVLDVASVARGTVREKGAEDPTHLAGRAAFTHRWLEQLEAGCATRRLELYVLESDPGLYFSEVLTPEGEVLQWAVLQREGETLFAGRPERAQVIWSGTTGKPHPVSLDLSLPGLDLEVKEIGEPLLVMNLLERVPALFRPILAILTQPSVHLRGAAFEARTEGRAPVAGRAILKVLYLNPL